ncbi:MAG TPA: hypothetical protein VN678_02785 [Acidobacteriaceae bacterium]|nr:hypothetical protein [Acidobacteriaceae bacterium]
MDTQRKANAPNIRPEQFEMALLNIAPTSDFLTKKTTPHKSSYLPLSYQVFGSSLHKNAVSIHRSYVSFMVPDWTLEDEARLQGLVTRRNTRYGNRLHFLQLTAAQVISKKPFLAKVLQIAKEEARSRQTQGNHA